VAYTLIAAEELGIKQANVDAKSGRTQRDADGRILGGKDDRIARALGVPPDWAVRAIKAVGNYGEIYERNVGGSSRLGIERGINRLWTQGGLLYAPPID